nr:enoyl-CoA hydratase/isomerase family protein [Nakamurella flavida]
MLVTVEEALGHLQLNRPRRLNALTPAMMTGVRAALADWRDDPTVQVVLVDGVGERGLCAGADIRALATALGPGAPGPAPDEAARAAVAREVLGLEYAMNLDLATFAKPVVAFMDGIVLGGGVGVSAHSSLRVVTERTQVGMPETAIGLCPDVGALFLLARAPGQCGMHAALTGSRFGAADAITLGLADAFVPSADLPDLLDGLRGGELPALSADGAVPGSLEGDRAWIDACYVGDDVPTMIAALAARPEPAARGAAATLGRMSPFALAVTAIAVRRAETLDLAGVLDQDLNVCSRLAARPDFAEGVRAKIIDKDDDARWQPATLDAVDPAAVEACFAGSND